MKTVFSYILFFTLVIRPAYNIGYVAYYELNVDYIIETYCVNKEKPELQCHGKCHLATQLNIATEGAEETSYLSAIYEAFIPVYFQDYKSSDSLFEGNVISITNNWNYNNIFTAVFTDTLNPPPQI